MQPLRILRVVHDYWPAVGGNERWSHVHDRWFSEVAGDDVQVVVLRPENHLQSTAHGDELRRFHYPSEFTIPHLPRVKAHQELLPDMGTARLIWHYDRRIRRWLTDPVDVVLTQVLNYQALPAFRGWPVVLEAPWLLACWHRYGRPDCARGRLMCKRCLRERGVRHWLADQARLALVDRFDLILGDELIASDLEKIGLRSRAYVIRHIVDPASMRKPIASEQDRHRKEVVDALASRYRRVLLQFNRLFRLKNPELVLDLAERLPEYGFVYAGDGPEREGLEHRVRESSSLRGRVAFLGAVDAASFGIIAERVSAFVMTSTTSNHNTSLFETMGLGTAPVVAVDTHDFPAEFETREHIVRVSADPDAMACSVRDLLEDDARASAMRATAEEYVRVHHSTDQMWRYRERLTELAESYRRKRTA